jgi:hypothetical protein
MTQEKYNQALRYVTLACFVEASQGGSPYYEITLNCGHKVRSKASHLSAAMICIVCLWEEK